ncbi:MAG: DUF3368 domain-containing protein [Planctomycetales bacterium]
MAEIWVANASPVIALAKCGLIRLVEDLTDEVWIPKPVVQEILNGPESDPARMLLERGFGKTVEVQRTPGELLEWGLGVGESSVIACCLGHPGSRAVLDDAAARICARSFGIPIIGTLGIIVRARQERLLKSAADALAALRGSGLYLADSLVDSILRTLGEQPPNDSSNSE